MAKNLQVNLAFTADTSAAMQNLQTLRNSLSQISALPFTLGKNISTDLQTAASSATDLQKHLSAAMDVKTGNLNLNKLQSSLQASNQTLPQLTGNLLKAGATGEKAFLATHSAIAQSNIQLRKSNTLLSQFALTMKNTAKWQLSSSLLHGLISGFSSAIGYAKDLDKSLNNIQIVTQQSADQMAEFAKQANKAAKELKTTTVAYTDAALIYYQQGLKGDDVTKRADTTVKLANVTGESAETVSQWMTAVWNNFDDGSKSLEYYADVMTALGAATASSSDEIAQGLEKFAAVADTVGLSYESATAALATITATTRQSADVVGTALKTLFARIQDLDLGKTLEDGTTLGSYSEALNKVGINIKDQNGQLKEMDDILDEMGTKWKTLDSDQQVALAKNVAGIRQYTQLIALMDNYDFYKQNQGIAAGAEGTLDQQAETYEQSWEAASKNVKASLESMYNVLIPKDFIIDFTNGLADVVSGFTNILEAAGGLKTILLGIASVVLSKFQVQLASTLDTGIEKTKTLVQNTQNFAKAQKEALQSGGVKSLFSSKSETAHKINAGLQGEATQRQFSANKEATGMQKEVQDSLTNSLSQKGTNGQPLPLSAGFVAQVKSLQQIEEYNTRIYNLKGKISEEEFEQLRAKQQQLKALGEENAANAQKLSDLHLQLDLLKEQQNMSFNRRDFESLPNSGAAMAMDDSMELNEDEQEGMKAAFKGAAEAGGYSLSDDNMVVDQSGGLVEMESMQAMKVAQTEVLEIVSNTKQAELEISQLLDSRPSSVSASAEEQQKFEQSVSNTVDELVRTGKLTEDQGKHLKKVSERYKGSADYADKMKSAMNGISKGAQSAAKVLKNTEGTIKNAARHGAETYETNVKNREILGQTSKETENLESAIDKVIKKGASIGTTFVKGLQGVSQMAMGVNMLSGAFSSLNDMIKNGEVSFSGILGIVTSIGMGLPMVISGFSTLSSAIQGTTIAQTMLSALTKKQTADNAALVTSILAEANAEKLAKIAKEAGISVETLQSILQKGKITGNYAEAASEAGVTTATWAQVAANIGLQASAWPILLITLAIIAAMAVLALVVVGLVAAFKAISNAYNADAIAAEKAAERAKELGEQYNKTKQAYDELKSSLEDYQGAYNSLMQLKKGTEEWRAAVIELNQQVLDLIDKYPELAQYVTNEDGVLTISKEGQEEILKQQQNKVNNTYNAKIDADIEKSKTAAKAKKTDLVRDELDTINDWEVGIGATLSVIAGTLVTAGTMGMDAGMGTALGATGAAALIDKNEQAARESEQALDLIADAVDEMGNAFWNDSELEQNLRDLGITNEELIDKLIENKQSVQELTEATLQAAKKEEIANIQKATQLLTSQGLNTEHYGENVQKLAADQYKKEVEKKKEEDDIDWTYGKWYSLGIAKGGTTEGKEKANEYGKAMGYQDFEVTDFRGEEIEFEYKDGDEVKTTTVTYEEMEKRLAENAVSAETALLDYTSRLTNTITDLANSDNSGANALASFLEDGDLSLVPPEAFEQIRDGNLAALMPEGTDIEQVAKDFGYASVAELEKAIAEAPYNADEAMNNIKRKTAQEIEQIFASGAEALDTSEAALESYTEALIKDNKALEKNKKLAAQIAVQNVKVAKGLNKVQSVLEDNAEVLKEADENSMDYHEAVGKLSEALTETFGMKVSTKFIKENLDDIKKMADNDAEALQRVRNELNKDFIMNLNISDENAKTELLNSIAEMSNMALNANIGTELTLDNADAMAAINEALYTGEATIEDIEAMFANANLAMPEYKTMTVPGEATTTHTETDVEGPLGIKFHTKSDSTTTTDRVIPYFGDKPSIDSSTGKVTSYGGGGKLKTTTTGNKKSNQQQLKYQGDSGSSGGGGGSSSKTATKEKKNLSDEGDFYHDINREIDRLADTTDRLADAKDRAFGDDKIDLINQEIEALEKEIQAQEDLIDHAEEKLKLDKQTLSKYGATYDKNGEITNYDEMLQNEVNRYNAAVDTYNAKAAQKDAGNLSDEEWEKAQEDFENAEERYSGFEEAVSTYETDLDIKDDAVEEAAEKARQILDLQLEGIQYSVDIQIEVNDYDLKVLEHLLDRLDDDKFDGTAKIKNMTSQMDEQFDNIEIYKAGIRQTLVSAGADQAALDAYMAGDSTAVQGLDLSEEQMNMLMDYSEGIMESEEAILELRESIEGQVMATFEAWHEEIENNARAFEYATTMAQSYKDIIDLMGKSRLGIDKAILKDLEATQQKSANAYMANAKVQMESTASALKQAQESLANAVDDESREMWQGVVDELGVQLMEDQEAFMSSWNDALQTAADNFTAQMDRAFEDLEDSLTGIFGSFDELSNYMGKQQSIADRYLNASEKTYELSKLNRKLQKDLDKTDSKKAQKELLAMQEEITAYQASGVEMSERDLQALQKKYDLKLAEIALEEAQNAKSTVRLTRDSEGNFGYVYTADENKVADAQQKYEDTLEANRQLAVSQQEELTNAIVENRRKMVEALREVRREDYEDTAAYTAALEEITAFYTEQETYLINEYQKVVQRSQLIYEEDYMSYTGWSQAKNDYTDQYYIAWQEKRRIANEIEALQSSGQWALLSEQQRAAYEQELAAANAEWLALQEAQSGAYLIMGQNADGWVFTQSELMTQLGCNIMDGITNGDGSSGTNGLLAALGTVDGEGFFGEANAAALGWEQATSATLDLIGEDYGSLQTLIQNAITGENGINDTIETNKTKLGTLSKTSKDEFGKVTTEVNTWQTNYSKKVNTATSDTNNLNKAIQNLTGKSIQVIAEVKNQDKVDRLKQTINGLGDKTVNIKNNTTNTITTEYKTTGDVPSSGGTQGDGVPQVGDTVTFESGVYTADSYGGGSSGSLGRGGAMKISLITSTNRARPYHLTTTSGGARGWVALSQISGYDTGGYTGEWGPEGRLAMLHQKEIVLNASDTENLLTAVSMIREISDQLEANALAIKYLNALGEIRTNITSGNKEALEQDITIHAEFPNATNHSEIEEAFRNLTNLASQYTNRKN